MKEKETKKDNEEQKRIPTPTFAGPEGNKEPRTNNVKEHKKITFKDFVGPLVGLVILVIVIVLLAVLCK